MMVVMLMDKVSGTKIVHGMRCSNVYEAKSNRCVTLN